MTWVRQVAESGRRRTVEIPASLLIYRSGGREKLAEEGRCRLCLRAARIRKLTRHHLVPKSWFDVYGFSMTIRDADANIVPLCRPCHDLVEDDMETRRMLRRVLGGSEAALCVMLRGEEWFDRYYPPT